MSDLALSIVLRRRARRCDRLPRLFADAHCQWRGLYRAPSFGHSFAWLGTPSALIMLSVAAVAEVLAYYIPVVDNLLDASGDPRRLRRRDNRVGGRHDRCAANGEMDGGRDRRRRRRRIDPRADRDSSGPLDRSDRRSRELHHRHRGTRRRRPDLVPRVGCANPRNRPGRAVLACGHTSHPAAISGRQILDRPDVAPPPLALLPSHDA